MPNEQWPGRTKLHFDASDIASLADCKIVVLVPEGGDEIQSMKSGLMEIADLFVINKADRPDADMFVKNLRLMLAPAFHNHTIPVPVIKTIASQKEGIAELLQAINSCFSMVSGNEKRSWLLAEKAFHLIQQKKMMSTDKNLLKEKIEELGMDFNLYAFIKNYY